GIKRVIELVEKDGCDVIISDGRYDVYNRKIPSFLITHQVRIMNPLRIKFLETGSEIFNLFFLKRFRKFLVPDYEEDSLSGDLSHNLKLIDRKYLCYIGVLSDFRRRDVKKDIDYLISLTGPEPQRGILEKRLMEQVNKLEGNIVVTLGRKGEEIASDNIRIYGIVGREKREELMNRSKLIVSRSGYSTIMDLAVIGTKALLIPTPGQIEQEYLASYHRHRGTFYAVEQNEIDLSRDTEEAMRMRGITRECSVERSVEKVLEVVHEYA
ncbi:MAG TPA: glycosyltransferase, partial [Thermoplasmatales archaeon]|nr:glycosyltransferase [Thermoplasmatales archaeon]